MRALGHLLPAQHRAPNLSALRSSEALNAGLPIVSTALGGANEILHPGRGLLVETNPEAS